MVRVSGLRYTCEPYARRGHRIQNLSLKGKGVDPFKVYKVAGWASVNEPQSTQGERPVWQLVERYLTAQVTRQGQIATPVPQVPVLRGVQLNQGLIR